MIQHYSKRVLVTGGAGFIGSHLVERLVIDYPEYLIVNFDKLTYAANLSNLDSVRGRSNYRFVKGDICELDLVISVFEEFQIDHVIHLAAESHVDRSIKDPLQFVRTNILGTVNLLEAAREHWNDDAKHLFYHISTDEVYGSLGDTGFFEESTPYAPNSPYSASKAGSDHFVRSYGETYNLPYVITNCSNNYGPFQYREKLIPLFINNIIDSKPLPLYGDGNYTRDWLFVKDHVAAIDKVFHEGANGETYNIGGHNEWSNLDLVNHLCNLMDHKLSRPNGSSMKLIRFVKDRPGHDYRYAIDASKIEDKLGWKPQYQFEDGLDQTVNWYLHDRSIDFERS